jgi:alpha-amylase
MTRSVHCLGLLLLLLTAGTVSAFSFKQLTDSCNNFDNENACRGQQTDNDPSWANRAFQTPPRGDPLWRESYQDYNILVGYARTVYTNGGANVTVVTRVNPAYSSLTLKYFFGDSSSESSSTFVPNSFKSLLSVRVEAYEEGDKMAELKIDDVDFTWNHPTVNQPGNFKNGQKGAIIEMFGWPYDDIAD